VVVALIVSFSMLGVFFFLALYMQDILRYSPLEAGIRFLPSTLMIVGVAPVAGRLADRFGPRWLIAAGLGIVAASLYSFSSIAVDSTYLDLLPGFMLLGIGIALTMSPMTSAAMNAVAVEKAGIASGVLSMFRMIGGSLGVAVTGAIFQGSVGANFSEASPQQFVDALGHAMSICAVVAALGAVIGATAIRAKRDTLSVEAVEAAVNPGGSQLAAREAIAAGEPVG
jgi:MFS family permease